MLFKLLQYLLGSVLDDLGRVRITRVETAKVDLFCLKVERGELGRLLGRDGRTVEAIRRVMNAVAARHEKEVIIDVVEIRSPSQRPGRSRAQPRTSRRRPASPRSARAKPMAKGPRAH
jgi:predicted RNA-binding protein YlqC (UPF0109 family)